MTEALIGLGSNVGDRLQNLSRALQALRDADGVYIYGVSNVVESEPWGVSEQSRFANAVTRIGTTLRADQLLGVLKDIEVALGRTGGPRYGPRVIDLDILLFGDEEWNTDELVVPHPRMAERDFVMTPLLELVPDVSWPDGSRITRESAREGRVVGALGAVPGFADLAPPVGGWVTRGHAEAGSWEEVSSALFGAQRGISFATGLMFDAAFLEQEGIPIAWDPMAPIHEYSPWSLPRRYRLLVPSQHAERARRVLADAHAAQPLMEEEE
jgi:2-amino-4-hydroxy-6-hydroxymethyldihydropteridine diphosphokinase